MTGTRKRGFALRDKYAIAGIGVTNFSSNSGKTVGALALEASAAAIADAGLTPRDVDGVISFHYNDSAPAMSVANNLGIPEPGYAVDFLAGGNAANLIVLSAVAAIEAGLAETVVCYRALNGRSGTRLGGGLDFAAYGPSQYTLPFGWVTYPQAMAMWCRRYMEVYPLPAEHLGLIATIQRENAELNPRAMQRSPLTMDAYLNSRMIVDPFRLFDICLETDGACAVVVTSAERAKDLRHDPVYIMGGAYGGGSNQGNDLFDSLNWSDHSKNYSHFIADDLWASAGIGPKDIDVAEIYDCFTYSLIMQLEGLGFCKPGEAGSFIADGHTRIGGSIPINTHGGLLSEGYIHGFNHVIEAVEQLRGQSGPRQVAGAEVALTTAGAMTCGSALVLRR